MSTPAINFVAGILLGGTIGGVFYIGKTNYFNEFKSTKRYYKQEVKMHAATRNELSEKIKRLDEKNRTLSLKVAEQNGFTPKAKSDIVKKLSKEVAADIASGMSMMNPHIVGTKERKLRENIAAQVEDNVAKYVDSLITQDPYAKSLTATFRIEDRYNDLGECYQEYFYHTNYPAYGIASERRVTIAPGKVALI